MPEWVVGPVMHDPTTPFLPPDMPAPSFLLHDVLEQNRGKSELLWIARQQNTIRINAVFFNISIFKAKIV
jgi:hypothetical protein